MKNFGKKLSISVFFIIGAAGAGFLPAQENVASVRRETGFAIRDSIDYSGNLYIRYHSQHPPVFTFVNNDGSITICSSDDSAQTTYMYEYSIDMEEQKTISIPNELSVLGAFTKDNDGNYYIFYATSQIPQDYQNMAMVKYSKNGEKLLTYRLRASAENSFDGIKIPFEAGTCRLELSGSMLAVYFAREMFNGHQSSYGFVLDKDTFARTDRGQAGNSGRSLSGNNIMPYASHSFNQFILPIDGGFVFADHGDASPRAFAFAKYFAAGSTKKLNAFAFPGTAGQNATYAEMGGLAKTSTGFIFAGTFAKDMASSRNLFVLTMDDNLTAYSVPVYLTRYGIESGHAAHPKIAALGNGHFLVLWEHFRYSNQSAYIVASGLSGYVSTFMLIIDENGKPVSDTKELRGIRLNMNDTLRYNPRNRKAYWAVNYNSLIMIHALDASLPKAD